MTHDTQSTRTVLTRQHILSAAQTLIARHGAHACTMRAVARRAKITPGAIYRHFADRQHLIASAVSLALDRLEIELMESIVSLPVGSVARIAALGQAYLRFAREHEQEFRVLFMPAGKPGWKLNGLYAKTGYPILRRCVQEAMDAGQVQRTDADLVALYLWSRVHGIATLFLVCDVAREIALDQHLDAMVFFDQTRSLALEGLRCTKTSEHTSQSDSILVTSPEDHDAH